MIILRYIMIKSKILYVLIQLIMGKYIVHSIPKTSAPSYIAQAMTILHLLVKGLSKIHILI